MSVSNKRQYQIQQQARSILNTITSQVYNCVKISSQNPLCTVCQNDQIHKRNTPQNLIINPSEFNMYVCTFCKRYDQQKCKYCFQTVPCCTYKKQADYRTLQINLKRQILETVNEINKTYKHFQSKLNKDSIFTEAQKPSSNQTFNSLVKTLDQVNKEVIGEFESELDNNSKVLLQRFKEFQDKVFTTLSPFGTLENMNKAGSQWKNGISLKIEADFLETCQTYRNNFEEIGSSLYEKSYNKVVQRYDRILYEKIVEAFRKQLLPQSTFKEALIQTTQPYSSSSHSISSSKSIPNPSKTPTTQQKVMKLQKVIENNLYTIKRLEERVNDLQEIVSIEQSKNQEFYFKIIELEARCGLSHKQKDLSMVDEPFADLNQNREKYSKVNLNKSLDWIKGGLKNSKSDPLLIQHSCIIPTQNKQQDSNISISKESSEITLNENNQPSNIKKPRKDSAGKTNLRLQEKVEGKSWLEQVVNQIKE